jgi:hypothetical protein
MQIAKEKKIYFQNSVVLKLKKKEKKISLFKKKTEKIQPADFYQRREKFGTNFILLHFQLPPPPHSAAAAEGFKR